ncbi:hypothetical protein Trydic_g23882 [Trypoxylus dichotomus]
MHGRTDGGGAGGGVSLGAVRIESGVELRSKQERAFETERECSILRIRHWRGRKIYGANGPTTTHELKDNAQAIVRDIRSEMCRKIMKIFFVENDCLPEKS